MTLKELTNMGAEHAKAMVLGSSDQFMTQFTLVKPNGHIDIIATPWADAKEKREAVLAVCVQALTEAAVAYSFCTEAWFATSRFEGPSKQQPPPLGPRPELRPDRKEGIVLIVSDGKERLFNTWEIIRGQDGKCIELKAPEEQFKGFESWITDALDKALMLNTVMDKDDPLREKLKELLK